MTIKLGIRQGKVAGGEAIASKITATRSLVATNLRGDLTTHVTRFFPWRTHTLAGDTLSNAIITPTTIQIQGSITPYAPQVEEMSGVNWTNPQTIEQPFTTLHRTFFDWLDEAWNGFSRSFGLEPTTKT